MLRRYEQKIVKKSKENALVIAKNGDIYILKGDENSIPSHKMTKINFEDALYTHNHPKNSNHEWGFSNDDFSSFKRSEFKKEKALTILKKLDELYLGDKKTKE